MNTMVFEKEEDIRPIDVGGGMYGSSGESVWYCAQCGKVRAALDYKKRQKAMALGIIPEDIEEFNKLSDEERGELNIKYSALNPPIPEGWFTIKVTVENRQVHMVLCDNCHTDQPKVEKKEEKRKARKNRKKAK